MISCSLMKNKFFFSLKLCAIKKNAIIFLRTYTELTENHRGTQSKDDNSMWLCNTIYNSPDLWDNLCKFFLFSELLYPSFNPEWIFNFSKISSNVLKLNLLIKYSGALHLCLILQSFIYKYYGATHLPRLFNSAIHLQIVEKLHIMG